MSKTIKKASTLLMTVMMLLALLPAITLASDNSNWYSLKNNPNMLAHYIDEGLYDAIFDDIGYDPTIAEAQGFTELILTNKIPPITGSLRGIEEFTSLTVLNLSGNQLNCEIPIEIGTLTSLTELNLSENFLLGSIPDEICNLTELTVLSLYDNSFSNATFPVNFADIGSTGSGLTEILLSHCNIKGEIPIDIGTLNISASGAVLSLGKNLLTGEIPESMKYLTALTDIDLRGNMLSGEIPSDIAANMNMLTVLDISANSFSGNIPSQFSNTITKIDLSDNDFSGSIPSAFNSLTELTRLDVSHNNSLNASKPTASNLNLLYFATNTAGTDPYLNTPSSIKNKNGLPYIYNQDNDGDGIADLNLIGADENGFLYPLYNIDTDGDGKADLNIAKFGSDSFLFRQTTALISDNQFWGYYATYPKKKVAASVSDGDVNIYSNIAPYYLELINLDVLRSDLVIVEVNDGYNYGEIGRPRVPSNDEANRPLVLNEPDGAGNMTNIDIDGDGIPDINIVGGNPDYSSLDAIDEFGYSITKRPTDSDDTKNSVQYTDPNGLNYVAPGGAVPTTFYNIDADGDGIPDYNVLPVPTNSSEFDFDGVYSGNEFVKRPVIITADPISGEIILKFVGDRRIQLVIEPDNAEAEMSGGNYPYIQGITEVQAGKTYEMKVYIQAYDPISYMIIPIEFNKNIVQIEELQLSEAFSNYGINIAITNAVFPEQLAMIPYQAGSTQINYNLINENGKFFMGIAATASPISIPIMEMPSPVPEDNLFFTIVFKVNENAAPGTKLGFQPYYAPANDPVFGMKVGTGTIHKPFVTADNPNDPYDAMIIKDILVDFNIITVSDKAAEISIIDAETKLAPEWYINNGSDILLEALIVWDNPDILIPPSQEATWKILGAEPGVPMTDTEIKDTIGTIDNNGVFTPVEGYYGKVIAEAISVEDPRAIATAEFELAGIKITAPVVTSSDKIYYINYADFDDDILNIKAELYDESSPAILWKIYKDGSDTAMPQTEVNQIFNSLVGYENYDMHFRPELTGTYRFVASSFAHPELTDEITIRVTSNVTIKGKAMLSGKQRTPISEYDYSIVRAEMDEGIIVELIEYLDEIDPITKSPKEKVISAAITDNTVMTGVNDAAATYNYTIDVDEDTSSKFIESTRALPKFILRFTKIGVSGEFNMREESYLCAELIIDGENAAIEPNHVIEIKQRVYLVAGSFLVAGKSKVTVTAADLSTIKAHVGNTDIGAQTEMFNINEYLGVDAADYSTVLRYVGKIKSSGSYSILNDSITP